MTYDIKQDLQALAKWIYSNSAGSKSWLFIS